MRCVPILIATCVGWFPTLATSAESDGPTFVEWTSTAGTSVVAKVVGENGKDKTITLERRDRRRVTVPIEKLSEESQTLARTLIREFRRAKNVIGVWYWRCPAKNELEWRIKTTLERTGRLYRLVEVSSGHSQSPDSETSYVYRKKGDVYIPVDERNDGEKRSPFRIDSKGDRISYNRSVIVGDRVLVAGGDFLDIHYSDKDHADKWARQDETFPPIQIDVPIQVGPR